MSVMFGPVVQQGYVVPDIQAAIRHWLARGVGPFFLETLRTYPAEVDGTACTVNLTAAFAYSGDQQIEVIQPDDDTPTIYSEFLATHPGGGLQHLAVWVDDIAAHLAEVEASGHDFHVRQRYGNRHAYIDSASHPGVMIQLMARGEAIDELFRIVANGARDWDGHSHPIRTIDWSSGRPVATSA